MPDQRYYITTAIPYVNGAPHVGHGLEAVQVDAMARYRRQMGDDTYFLTGSDDNSITNVRAAEEEGIPVADLVNRNTKGFIDLDRVLDVSYGQFIRTSVDPRHLAGAQKLWRAVQANGDIYEKSYSGLYCPRCELFYEEDELEDGLCPEHLIRPDQVDETNYFFRLSRYQDQLETLIQNDVYRVIPAHRKNEVLSFIRMGLRDFSISRSMERARGWGIPVPDDPAQVMYVWFDALSNYITALDYAGEGELYQRYWINNPRRIHAIGKGIIRFHAVYWPAMLLSAGVPLPTELFVHGYYTVEGRKMSKSIGNVIDPMKLADRYGPDALRYFFLAATPATGDTDFSMTAFTARYHSDLANDLGNLLNRTVSMINRYRSGVIPVPAPDGASALGSLVLKLQSSVAAAMERFDFQAALASIWEVVVESNRFIEQQAPWQLAKEEKTEGEAGALARTQLDAALFAVANALRSVAVNLQPFLPATASKIMQQLGLPPEAAEQNWAWTADIRVGTPEPIFPRIEAEASDVSVAPG